VYFKPAAELMEELGKILCDSTVREVNFKILGGQYSLAWGQIHSLLTLFDGGTREMIVQLSPSRAACEKNLELEHLLEEAEGLAAASRWNEMAEKLRRVGPEAPAGIRSRAEKLREQLEEGRGKLTPAALDRYASTLAWAVQAARKALEEGDSDGLAKVLDNVQLRDLIDLRDNVKAKK
jgi:hypothetical protein